MITKKRFTLIELLIVIVIIGVLAAIIVPNISNFKEDSTTTAMQANIKNIETALTMYSLENNGKMPVSKKPELGLPEVLMIEQLHPNYLRSQPKVKGMNYWLDYSNKVWASSVNSPMGITYTSDGKLKWEKEKNAVSYNIFKTENSKVKSSVGNKEIIFLESSEENVLALPKLEGDNFYLVNSVDNFGLESPPVSSEYEGRPINSEIPDTGLSQKEKFPWPMEMESVKWKNNEPALTDNNLSTFHKLPGNKEYLFEWEGDMTNRVFKISYALNSNYGTNKSFNFLDKEGKAIPFIDAKTDTRYETFSAAYSSSKSTMDFVVPKGATQFKIQPVGGEIYIYEANFVSDLSLPYPVEKVTSETTKDSMILKWSPPSNAKNFSKVAIYDGDKFLGYSSNGTYTVNSLYSDKEYLYSIEPISVVGNRGPRVHHTNKTFRPEIVWKGLVNANAFDSLLNSSVEVKTGDAITWEGDLSNRQINIKYGTSSNDSVDGIDFSFYNAEGKVVTAKRSLSNDLQTVFNLRSGRGSLDLSFIVPEGATSIVFGKNPYGMAIAIYDINYGNSLDLPSKLTNVTATSNKESISLKFNRPSDVVRVAVIRNGSFIAYATTDTFIDTSLYASQEYSYTFETFSPNGHRNSSGGTAKFKTEHADIVWMGLDDAKAFDSSISTNTIVKQGDKISWKGDLSNRQINIKYGTSSNDSVDGIDFSFYNAEGKVVAAKRSLSNDLQTVFNLRSGRGIFDVSFIVPEGATSIIFGRNPYGMTIAIYDINYGSTSALPSGLTNVVTTSDSESVSFKFNRPADVVRVGILRDGKFISYSTTDTFTDTSLYSNKEYNYTFETFNGNGHRTENGGATKVSTKTKSINWSGLEDAKAFDNSDTTYSIAQTNSVIRWDGDLSNRQINLYYSTSSDYSGFNIEVVFYDEKGKVLPSKKNISDTPALKQYIYGGSGKRYSSFIVPEGATYIKFPYSYGAISVYLLSIKEV